MLGVHLGVQRRGETWLELRTERELSILLVWGRPSDEDIGDLLASARVRTRDLAVRPRLLFDCTHLERRLFDDARGSAQLLALHNEIIAQPVAQNALVCAAAVAPVFGRAPGIGQIFNDFEVALDWLAPELTSEERAGIRAVRTATTAPLGLVTRLRQLFLREDASKVDIAFAARKLGRSRRSLQRALAEQGTSFRAELNQARLERAKRELDGGVSVTWLASELGFQNVQSFIRVFKQATGVTPGAWRRAGSAKRRAASAEHDEASQYCG